MSALMSWVRMPTEFGWWFFCATLDEWDLAVPVRVSRHGSDQYHTFTASLPCGTVNVTTCTGWWFGPVKIDPPIKRPSFIICPGSGCELRLPNPAPGESVLCECGQWVQG